MNKQKPSSVLAIENMAMNLLFDPLVIAFVYLGSMLCGSGSGTVWVPLVRQSWAPHRAVRTLRGGARGVSGWLH